VAVQTFPRKKVGRAAPKHRAVARPKRKRGLLRRLWWLVTLPVAMVTALALALTYVYLKLPLPPEPASEQTSFLYDSAGNFVTGLHGEIDRTLIPLSEMPEHLREAVIAAEDERFYSHVGVSPAAIVRAAWANFRGRRIEQGASTITQQYVRNAFRSEFGYDPERGFERTLARKLKEGLLAIKLERKYSKDEILERYLNTIYLGGGAYGVQAAAEAYFGVPAAKLSLLQSATLAGLISSPEANQPRRYPDQARSKRNHVLSRMAEIGYISQGTYRSLRNEPVETVRRKKSRVLTSPAAYFVDYTRQYLEKKYGYEETFAGGLRVRMSLDMKMQRAAERAITNHLGLPGDPDVALVAIDPRTGEIKAMVGGKDFRKAKFNLATFRGGTGRQTGSAFKVFTLAAAVEKGISLRSRFAGPGRVIIDDDRCGPEWDRWDPSNYSDSGSGTLDLFGATRSSVNTIFAQLVVEVGPERVVAVAHKLGIESPLDPVCSITLGTEEVTPLEMTQAFASLATGGVRHNATPVKEVRTATGEILERATKKGKRVMDANDAWQVVAALEGVVCCGTGTAANIGVPQFGKTGTAEQHADAYFCGGTRLMVACIWVGHKSARIPMTNVHGISVTGGSYPARIWHDFMLPVHQGRYVPDFPTPDFTGEIVEGKGIEVTPSPTPVEKKPEKKKKKKLPLPPRPPSPTLPPPPPPPLPTTPPPPIETTPPPPIETTPPP
jgi:membrane peptidoglycan carboxypeptidase